MQHADRHRRSSTAATSCMRRVRRRCRGYRRCHCNAVAPAAASAPQLLAPFGLDDATHSQAVVAAAKRSSSPARLDAAKHALFDAGVGRGGSRRESRARARRKPARKPCEGEEEAGEKAVRGRGGSRRESRARARGSRRESRARARIDVRVDSSKVRGRGSPCEDEEEAGENAVQGRGESRRECRARARRKPARMPCEGEARGSRLEAVRGRGESQLESRARARIDVGVDSSKVRGRGSPCERGEYSTTVRVNSPSLPKLCSKFGGFNLCGYFRSANSENMMQSPSSSGLYISGHWPHHTGIILIENGGEIASLCGLEIAVMPNRSLQPSLILPRNPQPDIPQSYIPASTRLSDDGEDSADTDSDWDDVADFEGQRDIADDLVVTCFGAS
ncbi:hypothetical protein BKA62DRAFT_677583 [Auriculariales sp. MPI-PUGE-AT-0066]|nr:hypothetical protein BKA62DRAFT_677583 [Auriculariales sp. MPI-PUGE-AT-0066]